MSFMISGKEHCGCDRHGCGSKPTVMSLGKMLYGTFLCLAVLSSDFKFPTYFYMTEKLKNFNRTALSWHLRKQVGVIACPIYSASVTLVQMRRINIEMK